MFDRIDSRSPVPLYAQIAEALRLAIAGRELAPGVALPSVRQLASQLRVNPATVVQAYRDLESEGLVVMKQGAGSFVSDSIPEKRTSERVAAARQLVRSLLKDAVRMGLTPRDVRMAIDAELEGTT